MADMAEMTRTSEDLNNKLKTEEGVTRSGKSFVRVSGVYPLDVQMTFECGQCFRFNKVEDADSDIFAGCTVYEGVAYGRYARFASPDLDTLVIEGAMEEDLRDLWYGYFALDEDYASIISGIKRKWGEDSRIAAAADAGCGIRILRQELWETLVSFIISQNNNIPRIKGIVERLCAAYGDAVPNETDKYSFPKPMKVFEADVDGLSSLRMGFRARYVFDAAEKFLFDTGYPEKLAAADHELADAMLREIKGVGPKVSACTLLFGLGKLSAFPIDVWIRRTVGKYFPGEKPDEIDFGELARFAGVIQQYIFNYERNCAHDRN